MSKEQEGQYIDRREMDREYVRKDELEEIIHRAVREALGEYKHECVLHLEPDQVREVKNLFCAIKEIGHGKLDAGVERVRENHKLITRYCEVTGKVGTTVITIFVVAVLSFVGLSAVSGTVSKIKEIIK